MATVAGSNDKRYATDSVVVLAIDSARVQYFKGGDTSPFIILYIKGLSFSSLIYKDALLSRMRSQPKWFGSVCVLIKG